MSFRLKTVLGIALIELVLLAILVISGLHYITSSNEARIEEQARVTARLLATMTADATVAMDLASLDELVLQAVNNPGMAYARIVDVRGKVLSASSPEARDLIFKADENIQQARSDNLLDVTAPIAIAGHEFGFVELGLNISGLEETRARARDWMLGIAGLEVLLVAGFGLLLGHILTGQLSRLQRAAERVSSGDFGFQAEVKGRDELAQTISSFNAMSIALAEYKIKADQDLNISEKGRLDAENRLYAALEAMPTGVAILDEKNEIRLLNNSFKELHELPDGLEGQPLDRLIEIQGEGLGLQPYHFCEEIGERDRLEQIALQQLRFMQPENNSCWESQLSNGKIVFSRLERVSGSGMVLVETDVTELYQTAEKNKEIELALTRKQKLESLGTLAGGIAHEINTPAQYIADNLRFVTESIGDLEGFMKATCKQLEEAGQSETVSELREEHDLEYLMEELPLALKQGLGGVERISEIVQAVKTYSHPESVAQSELDLNKAVENAVLVTKSKWRYHAEVDLDLSLENPPVMANEGQIGQVLINLIVNACDALAADAGEGSRLGKIIISSEVEAGFVLISLADDGPGIPEDVQDRIFEMFFTTKEVGKGTGQGLAICKTIIEEQHAGSLTLTSLPGQGTTFQIRLPIPEEEEHTANLRLAVS